MQKHLPLILSIVVLMTLAVISHGETSSKKIDIKNQKYTCCMPRAHTVHAKVTRMGLSGCDPSNGNCHFDGMKIIREKHMPDFFHRRYRLDLQIEVNGQVVSDETTLGFMDQYPSNFGVEYVFNKTSCSCKQLTRQAAYLMVSCVDADYKLEGVVDIGIKSEDHIESQKFIRTKQVNSNTTQIDIMVVQPVQTKQPPLPYPDPYPSDYNCAIVYSDTRIESRNSKGQLSSLETISSECWNFLPFNTDSDYILPSYCPKLQVTAQIQQQSPVKYIVKTVGPSVIPDIGVYGITLYKNDLYMADGLNKTIRVLSLQSETISPIMIGNHTASSDYANDYPDGLQSNVLTALPVDVHVFNNTLFYVDRTLRIVRKLSLLTWPNSFVSTIAGNITDTNQGGFVESGSAFTALNIPYSVFPVSDNEFYLVDAYRLRLVKDGMISTIAGSNTNSYSGENVPAKSALLGSPKDVFVRNGKIYLTDTKAVRVINETGYISTLAITGLTGAWSLFVTQDDVVFVTETTKNLILRVDKNGNVTTIAGGGISSLESVDSLQIYMNNSRGITFNETTGVIYYSEFSGKRVRSLTPYCPSGYYLNQFKTMCITYWCSGIESISNGTVCLGRGDCIGTDTCQCKNGYFGNNCELVKCFGILSNESSTVCSGHGTCGGTNNCTCAQGFFGPNCGLFYCNGVLSNDPNVCSGNGTCKPSNFCDCALGYSGLNCQNFNCFGLSSNASNVCSGNGACVKYNACSCNSNYTGADCSLPVCFGYSSSSLQVCSGKGVCIGPNKCKCYAYYDGSKCEVDTSQRSMNVVGVPNVIVKGIKNNVDTNIIGLDLRSGVDLTSTRDACSTQNCTVALKYSWAISYNNEKKVSSTENIIGNLKKPSNTEALFKLTFNPVISIKNLPIIPTAISGNVTFTLIISSTMDQTFNISQDILLVSSPSRDLVTSTSVSPIYGVSLKTSFIAQEQVSVWSFPDLTSQHYLSPLQFAFGFKYQSSIIRISEFSDGGISEIYLPYLNETSQSGIQNLDLLVICRDALNNQYTESGVVTVSVRANLDDSVETLKSRMASIAAVFPYDTSLKLRNEDAAKLSSVIVESVNKITIDVSNPSTALTNLKQVTTYASSSEVASAINYKLENYLSQVNEIYKKEKETLGYVTKQRLSDSDLSTTLISASNLLSFGFSNVSNTCTQFTSVLLLQQTVKVLTDSITPTVYSSNLINVTVSSFTKTSNNTKLDKFSDISLDSDYILTKYDGFNKEIGISLITYSDILFNSNQTQLTNSKDFTLYLGGKSLSLSDLTQPIFINFTITNQTLSLNSSQISCQFWNETTLQWDSNGCSLSSLQSTTGDVICQCSHTTLFAAFIENSLNNTSTDQIALQQLSSLYIAQISFGVLFFILSCIIMGGLIGMRKSQPLKSRFVTPFIGMIALIVESGLFLITQRSILLSATQGLTFSLKSSGLTESTVIQLENGNLASNIVSNIITIIVNTLTLTAMFSYLYQTSRFHILKYFYHSLSIKFSLNQSNSNGQQGEKILKMLRIFLSTRVMISIMGIFIVLNLAYWTLWVILVRTSVITGTEYSYIVSISFTIILLSIGFLICALIILDVIMSLLNIKKEKDIVSDNNNEKSTSNFSNSSISLNKDALQKFDKESAKKMAKIPLLRAYDWFIHLDTPLYFRVEMILFVVCFTFLVISQIIGLSGLSYKRGDTTSRVNDSISLLFEILYLFTYLLVFGGFTLLVRLVHFIKQKKNATQLDENSENNELIDLLSSVEGLKLFQSFCEKEYSLENLHLYLEIKHNQELINSADRIDELNSFIENIFTTYITGGSLKEVNIPSECRNEFKQVRESLGEVANNSTNLEMKNKNEKAIPEAVHESLKQAIFSLQDQIIVNLNDTFSRFTITDEFSFYENSVQTKQQLLNDTKLA